MKRYILILCFLIVGIASANESEYPPITPENAHRLEEVDVLGTGAANPAVAWASDGRVILGGTRGLYIYDDLQAEPEFIALGINIKSLLFAGEILFFSDDSTLYAYDLANQQILYSLEGQKPLAVSESATMLAYEVDLGVNVLEIATAEILFNLDYSTRGWNEAAEGLYSEEYRFTYAHFFADDTELVVEWMYHEVRNGSGAAGGDTEFWNLNDLSWMNADDYFGRDSTSEFMGVGRQQQLIRYEDFELEDECSKLYTDDFEIHRLLVGHLLALACYPEETDSTLSVTGIWNWQTGEQIAVLPKAGRMQISPDLSKIAIDTEIYDIATGESLGLLLSNHYEFFGGNILEYSHDNQLRLLDALSYEEIAILPIRPDELLRRQDDVFIHKNRHEAYWIDDTSGQTLAHFVAEDAIIDEHESWSFNTSGSYALSFNRFHGIYLWDVATGEAVQGLRFEIKSDYFYEGRYLLVQNSNGFRLYDPVDESSSWEFDYEGGTNQIVLETDYLFLLGNTLEVFDLATEELILTLPNPQYHLIWHFAWSEELIAYYEDGKIVILSFPDGEPVQRIQTDAFGSLELYADRTLIIYDENTQRPSFYDIATGELVNDPRPVPQVLPCIESESLNFFCDGNVWVETKDGITLHETPMAFVRLDAMLSSDESRLLILYPDGIIGVWAVPD